MTVLGGRLQTVFDVVQVGPMNRPEVANAVGLANQIQRSFRFELRPDALPLPDRYRLRNHAYDLDAAVVRMLSEARLRAPVIAVTAAPYGDRNDQDDPGSLYFSEYELQADPPTSVVSTQLWCSLPGRRLLQPYVLFSLAGIALGHLADLHVHTECRGCVFDYCDDPQEIDMAVSSGRLCVDCERVLGAKVRQGRVTNEQAASINRLLSRASGSRIAFLIMPFRRTMKPIYHALQRTLEQEGWVVRRADRSPHPRRITDMIVQSVLAADLVVADITGSNPNVFYELGLAHAAASDVLMITQDERIPFDVSTERALQYSCSKTGLKRLVSELRHFVGERQRD